MRHEFFFMAAAAATVLLLAAVQAPARAASESRPVQVDLMSSCHRGLIAWKPLAPDSKCGYAQTPQVKIFDRAGRLRFIGSALDAIRWAKAGQPVTSIPKEVVVRDLASEASLTRVDVPPSRLGWVSFYVSKPCPPCEQQLALFRSDALARLGVGTGMAVLELATAGD